jgi:hypothetical protein
MSGWKFSVSVGKVKRLRGTGDGLGELEGIEKWNWLCVTSYDFEFQYLPHLESLENRKNLENTGRLAVMAVENYESLLANN